MIHPLRRRPRALPPIGGGEPLLDIAPLSGIALLLLGLFLANLAWVQKVPVVPAGAAVRGPLKDEMVVGVSGAGTISLEGSRIELAAVRSTVGRMLARRPRAEVTVLAEGASRAFIIARVIDELKL